MSKPHHGPGRAPGHGTEGKDATGAPESDFIRDIVSRDVSEGTHGGRVQTRFPPEPNGYLHIGHAKAICLDFGIAEEYAGTCNLRMDDTNPENEDLEFAEAIKADIHWLGFDWEDRFFFASDYFERLYQFAEELIEKGKAYVCDLTDEEIRATRGTISEPGKPSPYRDRTPEESLDLFRRMRAGEFEDGSRVLRAKIDMASPNMKMRDPLIYRIRRAHHYRTGDTWCIYPFYDFAHCLSDSIEMITHSLCTLEFQDNRELYDWYVEQLDTPSTPRQYEFAPMVISYTVMSKRRLKRLVEEGHVSGWDDPRMPTLSGLRRRGFAPEAIRDFVGRLGVAKREGVVDVALMEHCQREYLNKVAARYFAVLNPLKVVIENYPEGQVDELDCINNPEDPDGGSRVVPFSREIYIERDDFMEDPPKKFFRLAPGREVRLRYAYFITCTEVIKDDAGNVVELRCTYDPASKGGDSPDGRKVKATLHWVSAAHAIEAEVRWYENLYTSPDPMSEDGDFVDYLNPDSLQVLEGCKLEPALADVKPGTTVQFERKGYFCPDVKDTTAGKPVFNRTVGLRDSWARIQKQQGR